jgi:hypothetical protein
MTLTLGGWIVMVLSVGSVLSLVSFCLIRVLSLPPIEIDQHLEGPVGNRYAGHQRCGLEPAKQ